MIKKITLILFLIFIFLTVVLSFNYAKGAKDIGVGTEGEIKKDTASDENGNIPTPPEGIVPTGEGRTVDNPLGNSSLQNVIDNIFNIAFGIAGIIAVAYLIVGGYQYITSQGNPDAAAQAKSTIVNSIIGLIIVLTSYLIVRFALGQLHAGGILG